MEVSYRGTPKSSILMGCSLINQPCWIPAFVIIDGNPLIFWQHVVLSVAGAMTEDSCDRKLEWLENMESFKMSCYCIYYSCYLVRMDKILHQWVTIELLETLENYRTLEIMGWEWGILPIYQLEEYFPTIPWLNRDEQSSTSEETSRARGHDSPRRKSPVRARAKREGLGLGRLKHGMIMVTWNQGSRVFRAGLNNADVLPWTNGRVGIVKRSQIAVLLEGGKEPVKIGRDRHSRATAH